MELEGTHKGIGKDGFVTSAAELEALIQRDELPRQLNRPGSFNPDAPHGLYCAENVGHEGERQNKKVSNSSSEPTYATPYQYDKPQETFAQDPLAAGLVEAIKNKTTINQPQNNTSHSSTTSSENEKNYDFDRLISKVSRVHIAAKSTTGKDLRFTGALGLKPYMDSFNAVIKFLQENINMTVNHNENIECFWTDGKKYFGINRVHLNSPDYIQFSVMDEDDKNQEDRLFSLHYHADIEQFKTELEDFFINIYAKYAGVI